MSDLAGQWLGTVFGTNHGNAFLELEEQEGALSGTIRFMEAGVGVAIYAVEMDVGDEITMKLTPTAPPKDGDLAPGTAKAVLQPDGSLTGRWETESGTAGTFHFRRDAALQTTSGKDVSKAGGPEQVFFHTAPIGAVRLYHSDLRRLLDAVARDFLQVEPVVSYVENEVQVSKFVSGFLKAPPAQPLKSIKISIQEPEPSGLVKLVNIDLLEGAGSQVRTSGTSESWVVGKAFNLRAEMASHEDKLVSWYRRYGLSINSAIFLALLVAAPEIEHWPQRAMLVGVVFALLFILSGIYNKLVPNTLVFASDIEPTWWSRVWPSALSWVAAVTGSFVAMWVFWLLTRDQ